MKRALELAVLFSLSPLVLAHAQAPVTDVQNTPAAPIVRSSQNLGPNLGPDRAPGARVFDAQPSAGVFVRTDAGNGVETVTATEALTELRLINGRATITVHHPANHTQILVDLPGGGQVSLFKDGLYTFNAATSTIRVLHGEAEAFRGPHDEGKGTKVKETQQLSFAGNGNLKAVNAYPYELTADLLSGSDRSHGDGPRGGYYGGGYEGFYPSYAWGYAPYGYGFYPYGYGYPFGVGLGFGYYGGFRGGFGGYRGFRR